MVLAPLTKDQSALLGLLIDWDHDDRLFQARQYCQDDLVECYLKLTAEEYIDPSRSFSAKRYKNSLSLPLEPGEHPYLHYLLRQVGEDNLVSALAPLATASATDLHARFDSAWYARTYRDVAAGGDDLLVHYLVWGWREGRRPSPDFSASAYLASHPDVLDAGLNPFTHWIANGMPDQNSVAPAATLDFGAEGLLPSQRALLTQIAERLNGDADAPGSAAVEPAASTEVAIRRLAPSFNPGRYRAAHPQVDEAGHDPLLHYLLRHVGEAALFELFLAPSSELLAAVRAEFDASWYLYSCPEVETSGEDAFIHYMTVGWQRHCDPSRDFSTRAYLLRYPDIGVAGVNPFLHWIAFGRVEGRTGTSSANTFRGRPYAPSVTAVLVNDPAAPLPADCVAAIARQTYSKLDVLLVGAAMEASGLAALRTGPDDAPRQVRHVLDDASAPASATLMGRAAALATSDLLWFVRGPGVHHPEFLARLVSGFADQSVQLGFGRRLEPADLEFDLQHDDLSRRMQGWAQHAPVPAALWLPAQLRLETLGSEPPPSFLWRRRELDPNVWRAADDGGRLAVWHLFVHMASGGQIAVVRDALLRGPPIAVDLPPGEELLAEAERLAVEVQAFWPLPADVMPGAPRARRRKAHVLVVTHGIFAGGAENLPIQMANALTKRGLIVSMLLFKTDLNPEMRATLDPGVSIFEGDSVLEYGCDRFVRDLGCTLIHSHGIVGEMFFFRFCEEPLPVPYVATLHGSYEASSRAELPDQLLRDIVSKVDLFVYTADKNLAPLLRSGVDAGRLVKMINAMPVDPASFPQTRAQLGIAEDAVVFTLVARGIAEKGWQTAIDAFVQVRARHPHRRMHLCMVGEGDETDRLRNLFGHDPSISFLGFALRIHGLYRISDVAVVPTRFAGESFPLCIIQALQEGTPVVATRMGEIASMLEDGNLAGGLVVEPGDDDALFTRAFAVAMEALLDDRYRQALSAGASALSRRYDMDAFTDQYIALYEAVCDRFEPGSAQPRTHKELTTSR